MGTAAISEPDIAFNLFRAQRARRQFRQQQVEPTKVINLAAHAVMTQDKFLATEIISQLGRLLKRERSLAFLLRQELARVIVIDSKANDAITIARNRVQRTDGTANRS